MNILPVIQNKTLPVSKGRKVSSNEVQDKPLSVSNDRRRNRDRRRKQTLLTFQNRRRTTDRRNKIVQGAPDSALKTSSHNELATLSSTPLGTQVDITI